MRRKESRKPDEVAMLLDMPVMAHAIVASVLWLALITLWVWRAACALRPAFRALWRRSPEGPRQLFPLALLALFVAALTGRVLAATGGPGDLWMNQFDVFTDRVSWYGASSRGLNQLLLPLVGGGETFLLVASLVLGSLAAVFAALFATEATDDRRLGLLTGLVVASQPLLIRFSGTMNRQMQVAALLTCALWCLARYHRRGGLVWLLGYAAAALLCATTRPEGIVVAAPAILYSTFLAGTWRRRKKTAPRAPGRVRAFLAHAVVVAVPVLLNPATWSALDSRSPLDSLGRTGIYLPTLNNTVWLSPDFAAPVLAALVLVGAAGAVGRRSGYGLMLLAATYIAALPAAPYNNLFLARIADARYMTIPLVVASLLGGYGLGTLLDMLAWPFRRARRVVMAAGLVTVLALLSLDTASTYHKLLQPKTIDLEYRFIKDAAAELPPDAVIYFVYEEWWDMGLRPPRHLAWLHGDPTERWFRWPDEVGDAPPSGPTYYYHMASCAFDYEQASWYYRIDDVRQPKYAQIIRNCQEALARFGSDPVRTTTLPARHYADDEYTTEHVPVGFYRISDGPSAP